MYTRYPLDTSGIKYVCGSASPQVSLYPPRATCHPLHRVATTRAVSFSPTWSGVLCSSPPRPVSCWVSSVPLLLISGTTFTHWIADHNTLWRSPLTAEALVTSIRYYSVLNAAPNGIGWAYVLMGVIALASAGGSLVKGYKGRGGEVLFDGGSVGELAFMRPSVPR
jgi:hypothetical protein